MSDQVIHCQKCQHFYTTWDPYLPRGCRKFGIKTQRLPCQVVKQETGQDCLGFTPKKSKNPKADDLDLNDDSLW